MRKNRFDNSNIDAFVVVLAMEWLHDVCGIAHERTSFQLVFAFVSSVCCFAQRIFEYIRKYAWMTFRELCGICKI